MERFAYPDIAFIGKMHSGKTLSANYLTTHKRLSFAEPVKDVSARMLNTFMRYHNWGNPAMTVERINEQKGNPVIRQFLQFVGTELGRNWLGYEDLWIDIMENNIAMARHHGWSIVVDDCRYVNEAEKLKSLGFILVKLERPAEDRIASLQATGMTDEDMLKVFAHPSELECDQIEYDYTIKSTTHEHLFAQIAGIVNGNRKTNQSILVESVAV